MGVVNVTPDSFSDGGLWATPSAPSRTACGCSPTAPTWSTSAASPPGPVPPVRWCRGARPRGPGDRRARRRRGRGVGRHDARRGGRAALDAGAVMVNDVSGGLADPGDPRGRRGCGAAYVAMHWRAHSDRMQNLATYDDSGGVVAAVCEELAQRLGPSRRRHRRRPDRPRPRAGLRQDRGAQLGAAAAGRELEALGLPLLLGACRKSFLGSLLAGRGGAPRPPSDREHAMPPSSPCSPRRACGASGCTT